MNSDYRLRRADGAKEYTVAYGPATYTPDVDGVVTVPKPVADWLLRGEAFVSAPAEAAAEPAPRRVIKRAPEPGEGES